MHNLLWGEFIPGWVLYPPIVVYGIYLSIKYRSVTLPTIANPGIYTGGAFGESKFELSQALYQGCPEFVAKTGLVEGLSLRERLNSFQDNLSALQVDFPVVLKPDIGQGGLAVEVARNIQHAEEYLRRFNANVLIQEYIPGPYEAGIYYCRFPDEKHGTIIDITDKQFPIVRGDGKHDVETLIRRDPRTRLFATQYLEQIGPCSKQILLTGEEFRICTRGSWVQGCVFLDGSRLWSPALQDRVDEISRTLDGFFIGRYDIRYKSEEDLVSGREFKIVELNGITAIPTSLKAPDTSIWRAWGLLCHVLRLLYEVGHGNRTRGYHPMSLRDFAWAFKEAKQTMKATSLASK